MSVLSTSLKPLNLIFLQFPPPSRPTPLSASLGDAFLECTQKFSAHWRQHFLKWAAAAATAAPAEPPNTTPEILGRDGEMRTGGKSAKSAKLRNVFSLKEVCLKGLGRWRRKWSVCVAQCLHSATSIRGAENEYTLQEGWCLYLAAGFTDFYQLSEGKAWVSNPGYTACHQVDRVSVCLCVYMCSCVWVTSTTSQSHHPSRSPMIQSTHA